MGRWSQARRGGSGRSGPVATPEIPVLDLELHQDGPGEVWVAEWAWSLAPPANTTVTLWGPGSQEVYANGPNGPQTVDDTQSFFDYAPAEGESYWVTMESPGYPTVRTGPWIGT